MIRRILFLAILSLFVQYSFGQTERAIAKMVQDRKQSGVAFKSYSTLKEDVSPGELKEQISKSVTKFTMLDIDQQRISDVLKAKPEALTMSVPSDNGNIELELVKVNVYAPDFTVTTNKNETFRALNKEVHYRGVVKGSSQSIAAISIFDQRIMGMISLEDGNLILGEVEGNNASHKHVLYNDRNLKSRSNFNCGTPDDPSLPYTKDQLFKNPATPASFGAGASCVRIYVETDFNVFQNRGSVANVNTFISGLFNQSAMLYQNEGIPMVLSQIFVWTSASPFNTTSSANYLASFQAIRNVFNGDLGHLVGFYGFGGIAAGFTGLCNANRDFDQCISGLNVPPYPNIPTYSWNVMVFTHEMGHLLGSRHTHACVWNGTGTAIDGCSGFTEGGCPLPPSPPGGGTIMSYCHFTTGINFLLGFGPQPSTVIRNRVFAATCLNACANNTPAVDLYIKDKPTDNGTEPNPDPTGEFWVSQDIWVRKVNDGITTHENPRGGFVNYIYVRVRNRGSMPSFSMSSVRLRTYWAKASGGLGWPNPFNGGIFGCTPPASMGNVVGTAQIPAIPAGGSIIMVFPWNAPLPANYSCFGGDRFHFCLLARIETTTYSPFGMTFPEGSNLWLNVKNNNNIAWKNVSVSNPNGGFNKGAPANADDEENGIALFTLAGAKQTGIKANDARLQFTFEPKRDIQARVQLKPKEIIIDPDPDPDPNPDDTLPWPFTATPVEEGMTYYEDVEPTPYFTINGNTNIWDFATVDVDLGVFFKKWNGKGEAFKILDEAGPSGYPWIRIEKAKGYLAGINVEDGDVGAVAVRIKQFRVAPEDDNKFDFDVKFGAGEDEIGGETFFANLGTTEAFNKNATVAAKVKTVTEDVIKVNTLQSQVSIHTNANAKFEASLYDPSGKLLQTKVFSGSTMMGNGRLPKGIYVVAFTNARTKEVTKKRVLIE